MIGSSELQVIQATLRVDEGSDAAIRETASRPVDWDIVQTLAIHHGVFPMVNKRLIEVAADIVPAEVLQALAASQQANEFRVFRMTCDLIKITRALEAEGIAVLSLKGPTLAVIIYGKPALRRFVDIDILVQKSDFTKAKTIMLSMGAVITSNNEIVVDDENTWHSAFDFGASHIELHWSATMQEFPDALVVSEMLARSQKVLVNGQPIMTLGMADTLLFTAHHGTYHLWRLYRWLADFAQVYRKMDLQGSQRLTDLIFRQGLTYPMLVGLGLSQQLLGIELPDEILSRLRRDGRARWVIKYVIAFIAKSDTIAPDLLSRVIFCMKVAEKNRYRQILSIIGSTFTPTINDYAWIKLPRYLRWLYPILKPIRRVVNVVAILASRYKRNK